MLVIKPSDTKVRNMLKSKRSGSAASHGVRNRNKVVAKVQADTTVEVSRAQGLITHLHKLVVSRATVHVYVSVSVSVCLCALLNPSTNTPRKRK